MKKIIIALIMVLGLVGCTMDMPPEPGSPSAPLGKATTLYEGYGSPLDVYNNYKEIFALSPSEIEIKEGGESVKYNIHLEQEDGFIYKYGYYYTKSGWKQFKFDESGVLGSNWIKNEADQTLELRRDNFIVGKNYVVTYSCKKYNGEWKCGCTEIDGAKSCGYWMLRIVNIKEKHDLPPEPQNIPVGIPQSSISLDLRDYYDMFINNGFFEGYLVIGRNAPTADTIAMTNIALGMQKHAVTKQTICGPNAREIVVDNGDGTYTTKREGCIYNEKINPIPSTANIFDNEANRNMDVISVGNPCNNALTSEIVGSTDCNYLLDKNKIGVIVGREFNGHKQIAIYGSNEQNTIEITRRVQNDLQMSGSEFYFY